MKISVFFDRYCPYHQTKDPGQIPIGLCEIGQDAGLITLCKAELADYKPPFSFTAVSLDEMLSDQFWIRNDSNVIIGYPLYGDNYSPLIEKMKRGGKKVILKLDSDGNIAYPLQRDYFRVPLKERLNLHNVLGDLWWRLPFESMKRRRHSGISTEIIKRIELCDSVVIESPAALENLTFFLSSWGRSDLIGKTTFIPNPVRPEFIEGKIVKKRKLVVSFGRWDDYQQKNTRLMVKIALDFLKKCPEYYFAIFGKGIELVKYYLSSAPMEVKSRIEVLSFVETSRILELLSEAQQLFVPSRWESFSIASAEALCMGCSVVGTPLESLYYLTNNGFSGTVAKSFKASAILAVLLEDAKKWDSGTYSPQKIAEFWRPKLNRNEVARQILALATR